MSTIKILLSTILMLYLSHANVFAKSQQEILMSILWAQLPEFNNFAREDIHFTSEHYYFNVYYNEEKRDTPVQLKYYLSDSKDTEFDATKVGQLTSGKYIIIDYVIGPGIYEIVELTENRVVLTRGSDKYQYIWTPRTQ